MSALEPGSIEHRVLALVAEHPGADMDELAAHLYGESITYAERQEMHDALARLSELGCVEWLP